MRLPQKPTIARTLLPFLHNRHSVRGLRDNGPVRKIWRRSARSRVCRVGIRDRKRRCAETFEPRHRRVQVKIQKPPGSTGGVRRAARWRARARGARRQLIFASGSASHAFSSGPMQTAVSVSAGSTAKMVDEAGDRFVDGAFVPRAVRRVGAPRARGASSSRRRGPPVAIARGTNLNGAAAN